MKLYVEGGGDGAALKALCREGFSNFITKAGIKKRPRIVACGGRKNAFDSFSTAIAQGEEAMLLVDSESVVDAQNQSGQMDKWRPWAHLMERDGWNRPEKAIDTDCHLMVQVMESWLLADQAMLKKFFDPGFQGGALPTAVGTVENIPKLSLYDALEKATKSCKTKSPYAKGDHSFRLLASVDPVKVMTLSPWARRFIEMLKQKMGG